MSVQIGQNFTSTTYALGLVGLPPDPNGAVGPTRFVEFINGTFTVYNKTSITNPISFSDAQFWANAGVTISSDATVSDPRIIYDPTVQRWFASEVDVNATVLDPTVFANNFLIAVSAGSNPAGTWHGFHFLADPENGYFADFPTLGVDSNAIYISGDMFHGGDSPQGCALISIPKADLLASTPTIDNRTSFGVMSYSVRGQVLQPVTCFDGSSSGRILATGNIGMDSTLYSNLMAFAVLNSASTNATLSAPTSIAVSPYQVPYDSEQGIPLFTPTQPDGSTLLSGNDARFSARVYAVNGVIYAVNNTELNGRMAIRWYRISATNYTLLGSGTIADPNLNLFYPSIAANANGTVVIACNGCSVSTYVSCYAIAGRTVNGVTAFGNLRLLQSGVNNYHGDDETIFDPFFGLPPLSRWGDYSTISVDPSDSTRFWCVQMYPSDPANQDVWSTQITELLTSPAPPQLSIAVAGTNAMVSWPDSAVGYQLQSTAGLASPAWSNVTQTPSTNSNTISVLVPVSGNQQFFRLQK